METTLTAVGDTVTIGPHLLIHGDCNVIMKEWLDQPDRQPIHHVITDPPYSDDVHNKHLSGIVRRKELGFESVGDAYMIWLSQTLLKLAQRWIIMTCDWKHARTLADGLDKQFIRHGIWIKRNGSPQMTGDRPGTGWEAVAILHRLGRKRWHGGGHHAVWDYLIENSPVHPTQKPVALYMKWLAQFTDAGETILDPFMGSGTSGVACVRTGSRRYIGIERDAGHFKTACTRVAAAYNQQDMFL